MISRILLPLVVAGCGVTSAAAQALPEVRLGTPVTGRMHADSAQITYRFTAAARDRLRLTMQSDSFDTVVEVGRLRDGEWTRVGFNDDADGTNSRLSFVIGEAGEYRILAKPYDEGSEGPFTLELSSEADPTCCAVPLSPAVDYPGALSEDDRIDGGLPYDAYLLRGRAGEQVVVTMRSAAFAPRVRIGRWTGGALEELAVSAGSGGEARAVLRFPADGDYLMMATAGSASARGPYRILVERQPPR